MQIRFEFDTEYGVFKDALNLEDDHTFSEAELSDMKQTRLANWLAILNSPTEELVDAASPIEE